MTQPMRFGLIGLGGIGAVRRAALEASPAAELSAAFDLDPAALASLGPGVQRCASAEALLGSDACEAVILSTPTQFHEPLALAALEAGKHVLVEKPMASTLEGARRMQEAARERGLTLTVGFNHRYFQAIKDVRAAVRSGAIGKLQYVKGFAGHTGLSEFKAPWMYDKKIMGGGTLMDNGVHTLDLVCHLMGAPIHSVSGMIGSGVWNLEGSEDNAFVHLSTEDGVMGSLHSSWSEWKGYHFYVEAYGDRGMARAYYAPMGSTVITLDKPGGPKKVRRKFYLKSILREKFNGWQSTVVQTFVEELQDFVSLARGASAGQIATAIDGLRSVEVPNAVYQSHLEKRSITLPGDE